MDWSTLRSRALGIGGALTLVLAAAVPAWAQVQRSGGTVNSQQLQQLSAERAALQGENSQLKQRADDLQKKLDAVTQQQSAAQRKVNGLQQQADRDAEAQKSSAAATEKLQAQLTEVITRYREMAQTLKQVEADRNGQRARADGAEHSLATCVDHNAQMYLLSEDFLNHVEHRGFWSSVAEKEPFTKLGRIRLDNLADDYRERINELRLHPSTAGAVGDGQPAAPHDATKP